ncbi:MAG: PCMD domain-containing protein [Bacteroidetes bacterium]|nr:PCMD domain-containing protein [Bacteroidota bacterium]
MKAIFTSLLLLSGGLAFGQTQLSNGGFENWGNPSPGNSNEPTNWYSNETGSTLAKLGPQTAFKDNTIFHGGATSVRVETKSQVVITTTVYVNGNLTTGVINAPSTNKAEGYIGTKNLSTPSDIRRMAFTGRPDSLVGWYQYTQGAATEQGKVRAILHVGNYYDPEMPVNGNHPDSSINKIGDAVFLTPASNVSSWTRFSVPFNYARTDSPAYVMVNITSSADQLTNVAGSKLWVDDLTMIYNPPPQYVGNLANLQNNVHAYAYDKTFYVDYLQRNEDMSTVSVYDLMGRTIFSETVRNNNLHSFNMSACQSGIYVYRVYCNGEAKTGKFYVE